MASRGRQMLKLLFMGDAKVGKTCLINQFINGEFSDTYKATFGTDFSSSQLDINDRIITLQIWDTAGQERYRSITQTFYSGTDCCILVYDVTKAQTFQNITNWRDEFLIHLGLAHSDDFPFLLLGNKSDLPDRDVQESTAGEYASQHKMLFYEVSAQSGDNLQEAIEAIVKQALQQTPKDDFSIPSVRQSIVVEDKKPTESSSKPSLYAKVTISSLLPVPIDNYPKDFTFIVNGEEFPTNKIVADFLSKKIAKLHTTDPNLDKYELHTNETGNFQIIFDLIKNSESKINESDVAFLFEVFSKLELNLNLSDFLENDFTVEDVLDRIGDHEHYHMICSDTFTREIECAAANFSYLQSNQEDKLKSLSFETIERILRNSRLRLRSENELLDFINSLYKADTEYSVLYDYVLFPNVDTSNMEEFLSLFDPAHMSRNMWDSISSRLKVSPKLPNINSNRYIE